jgi:hypothetical protein
MGMAAEEGIEGYGKETVAEKPEDRSGKETDLESEQAEEA